MPSLAAVHFLPDALPCAESAGCASQSSAPTRKRLRAPYLCPQFEVRSRCATAPIGPDMTGPSWRMLRPVQVCDPRGPFLLPRMRMADARRPPCVPHCIKLGVWGGQLAHLTSRVISHYAVLPPSTPHPHRRCVPTRIMLWMYPRYQVHAPGPGDAHARHWRAHSHTRPADAGRSIIHPTYVARLAYAVDLPLIILRT
jgi:hypothetical protein